MLSKAQTRQISHIDIISFKISYDTFDMLVFQIHRVQVDREVEEAVPEHTANDAF